VGHSEGIMRQIMRPLMLTLGATLLVAAPALIALDPILLPAQLRSQELKHWITASGLDTGTLLVGLAAVLLLAAALGVVFATRAQRRRERQRRSEEPRWTLQIRPNVGGSKPAKGADAQAGCVVARSLMREQVAFSGDTPIAPISEIGAPEAGARCVIHVRRPQEALRSL
jgi:hypothetical protein